MTKLHISDTLSFPLDFVTQTAAAIGRKGAGKTYLATMLAEQMLDADAQVIVLDAVGNWWGLRVDADGKSPGKDIFVVGGEHGDVPLVPEAGAKIARLLVEKRISVVLDISAFRIGERKRFCTDFAEEFFHLKKSQRSPVHLFIEEAQLFIPQRLDAREARMYGAFEAIVRIGRNYGIGATLITQRPQSVNKEVLSQVECLCVLQVNGTHERKALEEWVQEAGADRSLVGELPGLHQGEGFVWSPSWLRVFKRVQFAKKTTFDASATPEVGKAQKAAKLSDVDVESLRDSMKEVIEQAEKDDPKVLRRQINDLQKQLAKQVSAVNAWEKPVEKIVEVQVPVFDATMVDRIDGYISGIDPMITGLQSIARQIEAGVAEARKLMTYARGNNLYSRKNPAITLHDKTIPVSVRQRYEEKVPGIQTGKKLRAGAERMLRALCQWRQEWMLEGTMRAHAGMKKSGTFSTYLSDLRKGGYIEENGNMLRATQAGMEYFGNDLPDAPSTTKEVLAVWNPKLREGARRMLQALVDWKGRPVSLDALAGGVGMARSGTFSTYLSDLRTARLIETGNGEVWANKETLFL